MLYAITKCCMLSHIVKMPRSSSLSYLACKPLGNAKLNLSLLKYFRVNFNFEIKMADVKQLHFIRKEGNSMRF